jgi:probable rRNA maturation factor
MITLEIGQEYLSAVDAAQIEAAAKTALQIQTRNPDTDLTIVITGDEQLCELNRQYRGIDAPTDVLSFPADFTDPENDTPYLGDILISYPQAEKQAAAGKHATRAELQLLVVHGVLHLLGFDHAEAGEKAAMWAAQATILRQLGLEQIQITTDG